MKARDSLPSGGMSPRAMLALAFVHALLFVLAFPPFDVWVLAPLIPAPLAWMAVRAQRTRMAMCIAIAVQFFMWLWMLRWIIPVTAVGYPALAIYLAVFGGVFVWIFRKVARDSRVGRWPMALTLPIVWTGVEFFRGDVLFYGYPWYLIGQPMIGWPVLVQSADLFGTYFISFLCAMFSGLALDVLRVNSMRLNAPDPQRKLLYTSIVVALLLALNAAYGLWRTKQSAPLRSGPRVLAIQTNLPQDNKTRWTPEQQERDVNSFIELTLKAFAQTTPKPDVIVWPETMVPGLGFEPDLAANLRAMKRSELLKWSQAVIELTAELQTPMIVGTESWVNTTLIPHPEESVVELERKYTYNSAALILGEEVYQRYDKYFLTPFGETMPYISSWPWLERQFLTLGVGANLEFNLDSNPDIRLLELETDSGPIKIATPICFEDTVGRYCRRMIHKHGVKLGEVFVNISNDGWFNKSVADRKLHAQIARFRCIENRVPMIRSVNTGMTIAIDSSGRLIAAVGGTGYGVAQQPGWIVADLTLDSRRSLYGRIGEVWPWTCLILTVLGTMVAIVKGSRNYEQSEAKVGEVRGVAR